MINGLFCSEFFTDHFPGLFKILSGPNLRENWLEMAQNRPKSGKNGDFRENGSDFEKTEVTMRLEIEF